MRWADDGREIFYVAPDHNLMAVPFDVGRRDAVVKPAGRRCSRSTWPPARNVLGRKPQYAVARDGRFLLNTAVESTASPIVVAVNWMKKLAR